MSHRTYRRLTPVSGTRVARAQAHRGALERDGGLRRVEAATPPDSLAMRARVHAVLLIFFLGWAAVVGRGAWLALGPDPRLDHRVVSQHERIIDVAGQRGSIVDRLGRPFAISVELSSVFADPTLVEDAESSADLLAPVLDLPRAELLKKLEGPRRFSWLARQVSEAKSQAVAALDLPGVRLLPEAHRRYPSGPLAAQILGFVGTDGEGLEGLEARWDSVLMGDGYQYRVLRDGRRRVVSYDALLGRRSTEGDTLFLTLDYSIQHRAEAALAAAMQEHEAQSGMAVVMDAKTGALLALASLPSFDPNHFQGVPRSLFRHQAVSTVFEPGSTIKPFVFAALLDQGLARRDERVFCENGAYRIGRRTVHDSHGHGELTVDEVLKVSSNIGTAKLGERLGPAKLEAALRSFGFGAKTGVDLYGEERGILHPSSGWSRIGLATHTFGQGMAVTGIQLTAAYAALVNGGRTVLPHLVAQIRDQDGDVVEDREPQELGEAVISESTSADLREMLGGVMEPGGTGTRARLDEYSAGGKTGTAQKVKDGRYGKGLYVSSFAGFAPRDDPRLVALVVLDEPKKGHYGGSVAGPAWKEIMTHALHELGVPPDRPKDREPLELVAVDEPAGPAPSLSLDGPDPLMPDLTGLSARDALSAVHAAGLELELEGSGLVASQEPAAGEPITSATTVKLALAARGAR